MTNEPTALVGSIQKFSTEDGPGVRSTVFLKGCPLNCLWCHNPEMISPGQQMIVSPKKCIGCGACVEACPNGGVKIGDNGPQIDWSMCVACGECAEACYSNAIKPVAVLMTASEVFAKVLQDKEFYENTGGGVTISGGEVLMHHDFAKALIQMCGEENIKVCLDTSGQADFKVIEDLARLENVEYLLYDMKHINSEEHLKYTGIGNELILSNLKLLASDETLRPKLWMRMPLIKGINDGDDVLKETLDLYRDLGIEKLSLMAYHDFGNSKAEHTGKQMEKFEAPSDERMDEIKALFESIGMAVEITGREETIA